MSAQTYAFVTPSYEGDLQRCQLLCESMDRMAQGNWGHYILTADHDAKLFKTMEGPRRHVVTDSTLLPRWLKAFRRPFDAKKRWTWLSLNPLHPVWPMSGWHVQQFRKMLIARHIDEPNIIMTDSDSFFVKPFALDHFMKNGMLRLYAKPDAITNRTGMERHVQWVNQSARLLGISPEVLPATDYIGNLVSWRKDHALTMLDHIERVHGRDLVSVMGRYRTFSEYQIYGSYVDRILRDNSQPRDPHEITMTHWGDDALNIETVDDFLSGLAPEQIAIGVQSFTETSMELLKRTYLEMADKLR